MIEVVPTKQFAVLDVPQWSAHGKRPHRMIEDYALQGDFSLGNSSIFSNSITKHGLCLMPYIVSDESREKAWKVQRKFIANILSHYDEAQDEFMDYDMQGNNVVRMPRIGRGKHNIHFDPDFSAEHEAIATLAKESHFAEFLSAHMKKPVSLRETGLSMTRPLNTSATFGLSESERPGEGMEWHSDGAKGEFTILLGLQDVIPEQGCLRIVPGSHRRYVDGIGHEESILKRDEELLENTKINYAYRAGKPLIFDARTLHSVDNNVSDKWRVVNWFIYDCY